MSAPSTSLDFTAASAALKEYYDDQKVNSLVYEAGPFFAMVRKNTKVGGKYYPVPLQHAASQGRSSTFATAQTNQTAPRLVEFLVTMKPDYALASIDNMTMEASKTDVQSFVKMATIHTDSAYRTAGLSQASGLFRSGSGSIGQVNASGLSTGVITLMDPESVTQFEVDMVLQCTNGTTDGNTPRAALGYVIAVNAAAGTVTVSATPGGAAGTPSSWAASEYLLVQGDSNAKMSGLSAWLPTSAPAATAFYGVDRSVNPTRLGGVRYNGSALPPSEALIQTSNLVSREGGMPTICVTNFTSYSGLELELGAKVQYTSFGIGDINFEGIKIHGAKGELRVFPDRNCPGLLAYLLDMRSLELLSIGEAPHVVTYGSEGLEMLRQATADAAEMRLASYSNLAINAPGHNAVCQLQV